MCYRDPMMKGKIFLIGLDPAVVDFSAFPGLNYEKLSASLTAQQQGLLDMGFDAGWCLVDRGETAESVVRTALSAKQYDVVLIGAGVRTSPAHFLLFERLLNLVHEYAPKSKICFNTSPDDTKDAVLRWLAAPSAQA